MFFSETDRQIYTCPVTGRKHDPLHVKRVLGAETKGQFNALVVAAADPDALKSAEAQGKLILAARRAFALPPLAQDGTGVLDADAYDSLTAFTRWLRGKEPRAQTPPNSAPCTDCPPASATRTTSP